MKQTQKENRSPAVRETSVVNVKAQSVKEWLESSKVKDEIAKVMPDMEFVSRFLRVASVQFNSNPKLQYCSKDSLFFCMIKCANLGLIPDGRNAHLVPFGDQATLIIDYKGIVDILLSSGEIAEVFAEAVHEGDVFEFEKGSHSFLKHKRELDPSKRGKVYAAFSFIRYKDGCESFIVIDKADIEFAKSKSRNSNSGPWVERYDEMAKKTAIHMHSKTLRLSYKTADKISQVQDAEYDIEKPSKRPAALSPVIPVTTETIQEPQKDEGPWEEPEPTHVEPSDEQTPSDKQILKQRMIDEEINELAFEGYLKREGILSSAETISALSEKKASQALEKLNDYKSGNPSK